MPSGREYHTLKPFNVPALDEDIIVRMRAPPDPGDTAFAGEEEDSDDDQSKMSPVGAFPGTKGEYSGSTSYF